MKRGNSARDNQQIVKILSTDLSKAFDSLHPSLMISKLKAYGFNDELCDLLRSYLCNRLNRVKLGAFRSEWQRTDRGCPQGSALSPLKRLDIRSNFASLYIRG